MKSNPRLRFVFSVWIALALLGLLTAPAFAASNPVLKTGVILTMDTLPSIKMGDNFVLSGTIRDRLGHPLNGKSVTFYLNNEVLGQASTDVNGTFSRKFTKLMDAGSYKITAITKETHLLLGASYTTTLEVLPAVISVQTTPSMAGVAFSLNGEKFFSGADGIARISMTKAGYYRLVVLADEYQSPTVKIEFGRWLDEIYQPYRDIYVPTDNSILVGLNVYHLMNVSFVDLDGYPVDPSRIESYSLRSLQGDSFTFTNNVQRWIPASRVKRWISVLQENKIYYSLTKVLIDGANVVNQSEQRFYTSAGGTWQISLILYSLKISAKDGLFGSPVGKSVSLEYPDGHVQTFPLDTNGSATIHSLARGTYFIDINGVNGMKNRLPVALSRNQVVNSKILTSMDLFMAGGSLSLLALGLLLFGRPWLVQTVLRKQKPAIDIAVPVSALVAARQSAALNKKQEREVWQRVLDRADNAKGGLGLSRDGFTRMLEYLERTLPKSSRPTKLDLEDQLKLTLKYSRGNTTESRLAAEYHVSPSTVRRTIQRINAGLSTCKDFKAQIEKPSEPKKDNIFLLILESAQQSSNARAIMK